jgi:amidase
MKKVAKWLAISIGFIGLIILVLGIYVFTQLPDTIGVPPPLQSELFESPVNRGKQNFPVDETYIYKSAVDLAEMIKNGEATSEEIIKSHINFIKNNNYKINAVVWLFEEEALNAARKADEKVQSGAPLGLLHGIPVTIKEQYWIKDKPSTVNAKQYGGFVAPRNAALVDALLAEGAIIIGTTNIPQYLDDFQVQGEIYPEGSNPYDLTRTPGGSSGGGAAALAAGFTSLELGSDMGGSIRVPASFCGLYGLKPTEGGINDMDGAWPGHEPLEYLAMAVGGPMARTPHDVELMWRVLLKTSEVPEKFKKADSTKSINNYKIAWMDEWEFGDDRMQVGIDVKAKMNEIINILDSQGSTTHKTAPDFLVETKQMALLLYAYTFAYNQPWIIRQFIKHEWSFYGYGRYDISEFLDRVSNPDIAHYPEILARRKNLTDQAELFFEEYDFLILPVTAGPAFKKGEMNNPLELDGQLINYFDYLPYLECFSATGHPNITIPMGLDKNGLPLSIMIVGPLYSEFQLLHFAKELSLFTPGFVRSNL